MAQTKKLLAALRLGVIQMTSLEDVEANVASALQALEKLRPQKCDIICLPENAFFLRINKNTPVQFFNLKEKFWTRFQDFATKENCTIFIGSVAFQQGKNHYNSTIVIAPKKKPKAVYHKIHLFDVDVTGAPPSRESDIFDAGKQPQIVTVKGWRIGLTICFDVRFSKLYKYYAEKKVNLLMVPSAFLVPTGRAHWHVLMRARAIECQSYLVAAAQCGGHALPNGQMRDTFGHSLLVGPWGEVINDAGAEGVTTFVADIEKQQQVRVWRQIPIQKMKKF